MRMWAAGGRSTGQMDLGPNGGRRPSVNVETLQSSARNEKPRTRLAPSQGFLWIALVASTVGCSRLDLGKEGWQCDQQAATFESRYSTTAKPSFRWSFDEADSWQCSEQTDSHPPLGFAQSGTVAWSDSHWGGVEGAAIHFLTLSAATSACGDAGTPTLPSGEHLTYSVWIASHERWLEPDAGAQTEMVLLSTRWESQSDCGGHEIALTTPFSSSDGFRHVGLSFGYYPHDSCQWTRVTSALNGYLSPDSWSGSKWHHVVATVDVDNGGVKLYWNKSQVNHGEPIKTCKSQLSTSLCLGKSCVGSTDSGTGYIGLMDEVKIFDTALDRDQVVELWHASHAPLFVGDSEWFAEMGPRSTSTIKSEPAGGVRLTIHDGPSSTGGAISPINDTARNIKLSEANLALLSANLPDLGSGMAFGFNVQAEVDPKIRTRA